MYLYRTLCLSNEVDFELLLHPSFDLKYKIYHNKLKPKSMLIPHIVLLK